MKKYLVLIILLLGNTAWAADFIPDAVLDLALAGIATCTRLDVTSDVGTPANLDNSCGNVTLTAGDGNGDYTIAAGDSSGRKITIAAQNSVDGTDTGTAKHVVLSVGGTIKATATCSDFSVVSGIPFNVPAFDIEINDPS